MTNISQDSPPADPVSKLFQEVTLPVRTRLPDTRNAITHKFNISGHEGYFIVGLYENGQPGELFIKMAKQGSTMSGLMDTIGILTSLALQYGVPVEALARKFQYMRFEPSGWTHNGVICEAHSVTDYVFRWLGIRFSEEFREEHESRISNGSENAAMADQLEQLVEPPETLEPDTM